MKNNKSFNSLVLVSALLVCFANISNAQTTHIVSNYASDGYTYLVVPNTQNPPTNFGEVNFDDSSWDDGEGSFSNTTQQPGYGCPTLTTPINTEWTLNSRLLTRKSVSLPSSAYNVKASFRYDNNIEKLFVNGNQVDIASSLPANICSETEYTVMIPQNFLKTGDNIFAVQAYDFGGYGFFDMKVTGNYFETSPVVVAPTKGVQAVLLDKWGNKKTNDTFDTKSSVSIFIRAINRYSNSLEVSFAPNIRKGCDMNKPNCDPYRNISRIISEFDSKRQPRKLFVTVHLSFHASDTSINDDMVNDSDGISDSDLSKFRAFFETYKDLAQITVSPSLEDNMSRSEIEKTAKKIANSIGSENIGKLIFRRSPDPANTDEEKPRGNGNGNLCFNNLCYSSIQLERHGQTDNDDVDNGNAVLNTNSADIYSNDGVFIWDSNMFLLTNRKESKTSFKNINSNSVLGDNGPERYEVANYKNKPTGVRTNLLWRPAYNLFRGKMINKECAESKGQYIAKDDRDFNDCNNKAFDSEESKVLRRFLKS